MKVIEDTNCKVIHIINEDGIRPATAIIFEHNINNTNEKAYEGIINIGCDDEMKVEYLGLITNKEYKVVESYDEAIEIIKDKVKLL